MVGFLRLSRKKRRERKGTVFPNFNDHLIVDACDGDRKDIDTA